MKKSLLITLVALVLIALVPCTTTLAQSRAKSRTTNAAQSAARQGANQGANAARQASQNNQSKNTSTKGSNVVFENEWVRITGKIGQDDVSKTAIGTRCTVTFNHFPDTYDEFVEMRETLKEYPQGAAALQLMCYELFKKNRADGEAAFQISNIKSGISQNISRCKQLLTEKEDGYSRPYQIAAFLKGATPANGYKPQYPYVVELEVAQNGVERSEIFQATVVTFVIYCQASDSGKRRSIAVVKTMKPGEPNDGWACLSSAALNLQCREKSFTVPYEGLR